ncbi:MazG nucleotide pyrophosphohydrolase domain-containing protein [Alkalibacterium sp.]|nr:MAG: hypothetical protein EA249_06155 [Alkalibacterium sp.]
MNKITIISLLSSESKQFSSVFFEVLKKHQRVVLSSPSSPLGRKLTAEKYPYEILGEKTLQKNQSSDELEKAARQLICSSASGNVVYAVAGHPLINETLVQKVAKLHSHVELNLEQPFEDSVFSYLKNEEAEGFQLLPACHLNPDTVQTSQHVVINRFSSPDNVRRVVLKLKEKYSAEYEFALLAKREGCTYRLYWLSLQEALELTEEELEQADSVYLPPMDTDEQVRSLSTLQFYIDEVTGPEGDVWIREQNAHSLIQYLREETEELVEAIQNNDRENWKEELGDVLVQILYQTSIAEKEKHFSFEDVLEEVNRKIRRRHPHVFDGVEATTPEEVDALWQKIKQEEKRQRK